MRRYWLAILIGCLLTTQVGRAENEFENLSDLNKDDHFYILEHPQVVCYLEHLISNDNFRTLADLIHRNTGKGSLDTDGGYVYYGSVPASECDRAILWVHPNGGIVGGIETCGPPRLFTNDHRLKAHLPASIKEWLKDDPQKETPVWISHETQPRTPSDCTRVALKDSLAKYRDGRSCKVCNEYSMRCTSIKIIRPEGKNNKAFFFSEPAECAKDPCTQRRKAYLVRGDLVRTSCTQSNFSCVFYENNANLVRGWIRNKDMWDIDFGEISLSKALVEKTRAMYGIDSEEISLSKAQLVKLAKEAQELFKDLPKETSWVGDWETNWEGDWEEGSYWSKAPQGFLKIRAAKGGDIQVNGEISIGGAHVCTVGNKFKVEGRVAYYFYPFDDESDDINDESFNDVECGAGMILYRLNNAIVAIHLFGVVTVMHN